MTGVQQPVLVTGATGNAGAGVVQALLSAGLPVRAAASRSGTVRDRFGASVEAVALDFTDPGTWPAAYTGVRRMFLLRPPQLGKPGTQMLPSLEYARSAGVRHMVFLSLQGAEGNKVIPHAKIEAWLRRSGVDWTFVRASFFMQNLTTTHLTDIRDRAEIMVPAGRGATAFVDAADVAAVAAQALINPDAHRNQAWTPTGPAALTYEQIADQLTDVLGRRITYRRPGALRYAWHAHHTLRMPWAMVAVTTTIYTVARRGKAGGLTTDIQTMLRRPPTSFKEFAVREKLSWQPNTTN